MKNELYYYSIMASDEQKAYKMIFNGLQMKALNIVVSSFITPEQVQEVYLKVLYDNPLFYFINQTVIRMSGLPGRYILYPEYIYSVSEINALDQDIKNILSRINVKARTMLSDEFRLEKYLHDSVVKSVAYDYDSLKKADCCNAHSIIGAFLDGRAVCEGIAKAFKLLCNEYGIKCIVVLGKADQEGNFSGDCYHAWNLVKVAGESYYVDVTWDNMYDNGIEHISYDYFNVTTETIRKDHLPTGKLPLCNSTRLNYFYCTKSFVSTFDELVDLISRRIHARQIMFKASTEKGEFLTAEELKNKTVLALQQVLRLKDRTGEKFMIAFNTVHMIGKIIFCNSSDRFAHLLRRQ